jgi:hypothetical protein
MREVEGRRRRSFRSRTADSTRDEAGLSKEEDNALRQLAFFELAGDLSAAAREKMESLLRRDRRSDIRNPRPDPSNG